LSVYTMMTCFNGFFQDAWNDSLSEALLKSQGGAVAVWASTTLTDPSGQNVIDLEFYRQVFAAQPATLGDASRAAKGTTGDPDVRRTWTLFGDPAMKLR
jgi:Peptidase family C25